MKRVLAFSLVLLFLAPAIFAAGGREPETQDDQLLIAVSINYYNNFHKVLYGAVEEYAAENNIELMMVDAQGDAEKQVSDVENLLAAEPDAFILLPVDSNALGVSVDEIKAEGIPLVESSTATVNQNFDVFVGANDEMIANAQGEYIAQYLEANPNVDLKAGYLRILLGSPLDKARYEGLVSYLDSYIKNGRFEIIADADGLATGDYSSSLTAADDWMQAFPEMNCIVGQNDGTAVAAMQAVIAANRGGDVLILGCDGEEPAISAIKEGTMAMTCLMQPDLWGLTAISTAVGLLEGKTYDQYNLIPVLEITAENADRVSNFKYID
jgi:ribose transport system substrate-binding protein